MAKNTQRPEQNNLHAEKSSDIIDDARTTGMSEGKTMKTSRLNNIIVRLMNTFIVEIRKEFDFSGLKYEAAHFNLHFVSGVMGEYRCSFDLRVGDESYGEICLSSDSSFMTSDISCIENRLAGLLMNLHELLRTQPENTPRQYKKSPELSREALFAQHSQLAQAKRA